ncbi:MAG: twin-arginine translocase TatA/TatE family subunit [Anaeromyxobacter sp.]
MFGLRMPELLLILAICVLMFGASKLPALGAGIGNGIRSFKRAMAGDGETPAAPQATPAQEDA